MALSVVARRVPHQPTIRKMQKPTLPRAGFTLIEIMIILAIIGLLTTIAIPNFIKTRDTARLNSILHNLRMLENAKDQWALENKHGAGAATDWVAMSDYLKGGTVKTVVSETYFFNLVGSPAYATATVQLGSYKPGEQITP